jgi:molecular chaperone HtpG
MYLVDRAASVAAERRAAAEQVDELWAGVLDAFDPPTTSRPRLVLNHRNALVRRVLSMDDPALAGLAVETLYGQALLLGHHPVRPADAALLHRSFLGLLDAALPGRDG